MKAKSFILEAPQRPFSLYGVSPVGVMATSCGVLLAVMFFAQLDWMGFVLLALIAGFPLGLSYFRGLTAKNPHWDSVLQVPFKYFKGKRRYRVLLAGRKPHV